MYWNALRTAEKIRLARMLYRAVIRLRAVARQPQLVISQRRGVTFQLDLGEGIDFAMYLFSGFEPDTFAALGRLVRPGQTVADIGANSGVHTLPMARMVGPTGHVIAFEPTAVAFERLQGNLALNPAIAGRVTAVRAYLGDGRHMNHVQAFYSSWRLDRADGQ